MLLSDGSAYGCGDNSNGQICDSPEKGDCASWTRLDQRFQDVACGWDFTVGINKDNEVISRGAGHKGELGIEGLSQAGHFTKVMKVNKGSRVFSSLQNCVVVEPLGDTGGSRVYGWGSNTKCQLKQPKSRVVAAPVVIFESNNTMVKYAALGKDFTVLVDVSGRIVHACGNLPSGFDIYQWGNKSGLQVHCMWTSLHILTSRGGIYSYGNGRHGQLFNREQWAHSDDLKQAAVGSEHGVLLSNLNTVACWGWGEHGNCGRLTDDRTINNDYSNVVSPLNRLPIPNGVIITKVFAGCATTWLVAKR
ncbi:hypothetical protein HG536_0F03880 [Torulaspora globosa]|uniref:Uncharacterized protein n=1 Tax=Torulaspora globosa TaxID=48254 RepID=A0A7G3ZKM7_9SACH|nr:uncharacterized protein HG536_0F03880 [Torulaspora globosa]QLL34063.1 hypothetical protein HG536_0F03880 [Torulaspora globosa]